MVYDLVIPVLAIQARDSDGRKRADHPTTRERKPRAHRRVPEGEHVAREPLAAGPRRGPGLYPDDPRGRRHGQDSEPAVVRSIEEWFTRDRVKEIEDHRKEVDKMTGKVVSVSTGDKDGVIPP